MAKPALILQNPRPLDFYGPEDWSGGDDEDRIRRRQLAWDEAYAELTFWQRRRYRMFGWWK